jgi:hypothetical protein
MTRIKGNFLEDLCTYMIISRWILLLMWNVSEKSCRENQNAVFVFSNFLFRKSCRLWNKVEKYGRARLATDDNIIRHVRFACWITKAADTHSECVTLIAFQRQQWLCERASMLRYMYIACRVWMLNLAVCKLTIGPERVSTSCGVGLLHNSTRPAMLMLLAACCVRPRDQRR